MIYRLWEVYGGVEGLTCDSTNKNTNDSFMLCKNLNIRPCTDRTVYCSFPPNPTLPAMKDFVNQLAMKNDGSKYEDENQECQEGPWFNTDDNVNDRGDFEFIETIISKAQITRKKSCKFPKAIKVRRVLTPAERQNLADNDPLLKEWEITSENLQAYTFAADNQIVSGNTLAGFKCENSDQPLGGKCKDFEVQLCCPGTKKYFFLYLNK